MLYPLTFEPIFHKRVWGGRMLETVYAKPLPAGQCIGESWEIADRPGTASVITKASVATAPSRCSICNQTCHDKISCPLARNVRGFPSASNNWFAA